jgi:hypothetical protein
MRLLDVQDHDEHSRQLALGTADGASRERTARTRGNSTHLRKEYQ